ncbi:MAG TPA: cyclic nucleotide-binding domain-containing protein, partial [Rhodocyclaceae bacterium]
MVEPASPRIYRLSDAELAAISAHGITRRYPKNTIIVSEGDSTDGLFIVLEGRVKVFVSDEDGHEVVLGTQGPGEYFGEMALLDAGPRSASVMTLEPSQMIVVSRDNFRGFVEGNPAFAFSLIAKLIARVRALTENVKSLALMDVYGRLARLLL